MKYITLFVFLAVQIVGVGQTPKKIITSHYSLNGCQTNQPEFKKDHENIYEYDSIGNLIYRDESLTSWGLRSVTTFSYDSTNTLIDKRRGNDVRYSETMYDHDTLGRVVSERLTTTNPDNDFNCYSDSFYYDGENLSKRVKFYCNGLESSYSLYYYHQGNLKKKERYSHNRVNRNRKIRECGNPILKNYKPTYEKSSDSLFTGYSTYEYVKGELFQETIYGKEAGRYQIKKYITGGLLSSVTSYSDNKWSGERHYIYDEHGNQISETSIVGSTKPALTIHEYYYLKGSSYWTQKTRYFNGAMMNYTLREILFY